jgi:hypothetical protein
MQIFTDDEERNTDGLYTHLENSQYFPKEIVLDQNSSPIFGL